MIVIGNAYKMIPIILIVRGIIICFYYIFSAKIKFSISFVSRSKKSFGFSFTEDSFNKNELLSSPQIAINKENNNSFSDGDFLDSLILSGENNNKNVAIEKNVVKDDQQNLDVPLAHGMFNSIKNTNITVIVL